MSDTHERIDGRTEPIALLRRLSRECQDEATAAGLARGFVDLLRIRISQLNGCAYCLRMHTRDALAAGETSDRVAVLPAWRESGYFTATERAALALAEYTTLLERGGDDRHEIDPTVLSEEAQAAVRWVAIVMNAFNRLAVTSRYDVSP